MNQNKILQVFEQVLGSSKPDDINKKLKMKDFDTKFLITGPTCPSLRFTGFIKAVTPEGIKIFNGPRVKLIRYDDIESFEKAKTREEKKAEKKLGQPIELKQNSKDQASKVDKKSLKNPLHKDLDSTFEEDDFDNDDDFDPYADEEDDIIEDEKYAERLEADVPKKSKKKSLHRPGSGSLFIPKASKRNK